MSPDPAVPICISSSSTTSVPQVHFMSSPLCTASTGTGSTSSSTIWYVPEVCTYAIMAMLWIIAYCKERQHSRWHRTYQEVRKPSLPVIYLAVYESTLYSAMAVQQLEATEYCMTSVQPPAHFRETMYVEDTEYDDVLTDELAEKIRMMVLLQAIECNE